MNTKPCECHKAPCICGTGLCNNKKFSHTAKIENIDENGNVHYVESIYQKIPLKMFENMECCDPNNPRTDLPDNESLESRGDSNLYSINDEEKQESVDCTDCCEQVYSTSLPDEKHDCKIECNITAELYCQIKRHTAEPGETFSECSVSSSSDDDDSDESDDENIGEGSTDYISARGRSEDYNSEGTLDDEESFNPNSVPHSSQIEEAEHRLLCQNKNCCSLNSKHKCKYNTDPSKKPQENEDMINNTIFNENTSNEVKCTTIEPQPARQKRTKQKYPIKTETEDGLNNTIDIFEIYGKTKINETKWTTIEPENQRRANVNNNKDPNTESEELKKKVPKNVTMHKELIENTIVKNRKRKYGSVPRIITNASIEDANPDDFINARERRNTLSGRKRRVTLSNFVNDEQLMEDEIVPDANTLSVLPHKHEYTDAYLLLDKSIYQYDKRPWNTYVPCERSDFNIVPVESFTKKLNNIPKSENIPKQTNINKNDLQSSFIRQETKPFKPSKFLCFKYVPTVSPKTSTTSAVQENLIDQIALDPPEALPASPRPKIQVSRIPVSRSKYKPERVQSIDSHTKGIASTRRLTLGLDELRNVVEQRCDTYRRSIIPPESRKSFSRRKSMRKSFATNDSFARASTSKRYSEDEDNSLKRKKRLQAKRVTLVEYNEDGSDTSLRNKMKKFYPDSNSPMIPLAASTPVKKDPINVLQKQNIFSMEEKPGKTSTKKKVPLPAAATSKRMYGENKNVMQKTCCSQTGIHVCIKESVVSEKGEEESNILQMVNIDVTPKNSNFVKVNVMPTVPEVNKEGIITIPVQFQLCSALCKDKMQKEASKEPVKMTTSTPKIEPREELIYRENPQNNWSEHYTDQFIRKERENNSPNNMQEEPYVSLLWTKMQNTLSESHKEENQTTKYDNVEIQTDLVLGQKLLSKSLSSLTSDDDSTSSMQNKSEPVKRRGIDWNDILLPPPGSFVIKKVPQKKTRRRFSIDSNKIKDNNNIPSTSGGLPPTEEIKTKKEPPESVYPKNKLQCCGLLGKSHEEPYRPANNKSSEESFYDINNYSSPLHQTHAKEEKLVSPCTSKPEITWASILVPQKQQIKKIVKLDLSKTSTSITDQTLTDEYISMSPSPKTTDTYPNLSEDSTHACDCSKYFNDMGTNTSTEEDCEAVSCPRKSNTTSNLSTYSTDILKAFKEDPVLSAFKAFEEELRPVRKALAEVQSKLRALNIPELECLFKKDPILEYTFSKSNSQIGGEYRQPACKWFSDTRTPTSARRSSFYNRCPSSYFRQGPSEQFEQYQRFPYDDLRVYRLATSAAPMHSKNLSANIWKSFGSCDRNTIKCPYEKFWTSPNHHNMRNAQSYNYQPYPCTYYESRNSTPESNIHYIPFDPPNTRRYNDQGNGNIYNYNGSYYPSLFERRVDMINDYEDLDYPSTYRNTPTHPHVYFQPDCEYNSEHSLYSNVTDGLNSNHVLTNLSAKRASSFHAASVKYSNKYIPVKVRPITNYYWPDDEGNPRHSSTRDTSINLKNGIVYARTKIELPKVANKRGNNTQKGVKNNCPKANQRNNYTQSEYDGFKCNSHDCTCEYSSIDDNCYKEYLKNERYP